MEIYTHICLFPIVEMALSLSVSLFLSLELSLDGDIYTHLSLSLCLCGVVAAAGKCKRGVSRGWVCMCVSVCVYVCVSSCAVLIACDGQSAA